ncbi:MAG: GNAT family N-acetyltransferase [Nocardioidaceae bacterium]
MTEGGDAPVVDDVERSRFVVEQDGAVAQLGYRTNGDRLVLVHTEVPDEIGGRGIAGRLVRAAVERARRDGLTLVPWCPYARRWLEDHPDEARSVTIDWTPPATAPSP